MEATLGLAEHGPFVTPATWTRQSYTGGASDMSQRVLFTAYLYPPVGGAGVQRTCKFVKYLPEFGWRPSVLTTANPSVPLHDPSLLADVPDGLLIRRARTWEPGYALKATVAASSEPLTARL